jgi:hypothetical protein
MKLRVLAHALLAASLGLGSVSVDYESNKEFAKQFEKRN